MIVGGDFSQNAAFTAKHAVDIEGVISECGAVDKVGHATFHMITNTNNSLAVPYVKTTYPQEWISHYLLNNLMAIDPVVRHAKEASEPFFWSDITLSTSEKRIMGEAAEYGLSLVGYTVPTYDVGPYRGLFSITAAPELDDAGWSQFITDNKAEIAKLGYRIHGFAREEIDPYDGYAINLSRREIECLQYIAAGKTHTDMAAILGISEHTVRSYCRALRLKLNCSTLAQAVAKACSMGLL